MLRYLTIYDIPNDRSSYTRITPKGGGIAIVAMWAGIVFNEVAAGLGLVQIEGPPGASSNILSIVIWYVIMYEKHTLNEVENAKAQS